MLSHAKILDPDDQWLYLPALKKTKRIASSDRSGSFMGSDFSYADLTSRDLDQYDFTLMKETDVDGVEVWQIESVPRTKQEVKETGYTKTIDFVRQDNFVVIRSVGFVKKGSRLKYMEIEKLEQIDGILGGLVGGMLAVAGSSYAFDPWEHHGAEALEDSEVLEFFTPMRPEYVDN